MVRASLESNEPLGIGVDIIAQYQLAEDTEDSIREVTDHVAEARGQGLLTVDVEAKFVPVREPAPAEVRTARKILRQAVTTRSLVPPGVDTIAETQLRSDTALGRRALDLDIEQARNKAQEPGVEPLDPGQLDPWRLDIEGPDF
jgi:hypothetical protein